MGLKIFCFFILGIFACSKVNQWKQPTQVCFEIDLEEETIMDGTLFFKNGYIVIESFQFDGKRVQGADVYFTKHYEQKINTTFGAANVEGLEFDVPQGTYTGINLEIKTVPNKEEANMVIDGIFKNSFGTSYPIRFELNQLETFSIVGKDLIENDKEVDLLQNSKTKATILLNPAKWFAVLPKKALEKAEKVSVKGINTILINSKINKQLYEDIVTSLKDNAIEAIFVKQS